jgi:hypothetical protein
MTIFYVLEVVDSSNQRLYNRARIVSRIRVTLPNATLFDRERTTRRMGRKTIIKTPPRLKMALRGSSPGAGQNVWPFGNHGDGGAGGERRGQRLDGTIGGGVRLSPQRTLEFAG